MPTIDAVNSVFLFNFPLNFLGPKLAFIIMPTSHKLTVYNYIHNLAANRAYHPHDQFVNINRAMSDRLELQLCREIEREYIELGRQFNNRILEILAQGMWSRASEEDKLLPEFKASDKWCRNFRRRHNYVWRKARLERNITYCNQEANMEFRKTVSTIKEELLKQNQLEMLVNCDETSWKMCYTGDLTWAQKGVPSAKICIDHND